MEIDQLILQDFRNYTHHNFLFHPQYNVISGENARGKTNLLEAILYLTQGHSPRAKSDRELIRFQTTDAKLEGHFQSRNRTFIVEAELSQSRRRKLRINKVPARNSAALSGVCATVFFRPEDLLLIREGAAARRRFLDTALCQLRPRYAASLAAYRKCLEHKTRILRDQKEHPDLLPLLPDFNEQLIQHGAILVHYRAQYVRRLEEYAAASHQECSGSRETLHTAYRTVSTIQNPLADPSILREQLREHMTAHTQAELAAGLCLSGPHKDDLLIHINGQDAKSYASQGQTRTAALSLKLAEREIDKNVLGEYPILLLDDVLSELDPRRQEYVLNRIAGGQVFITCCEEDRLPILQKGQVFNL